jgi:hypothetical protein
MGRPLPKRFFGNENVGTAGTTDDGIGGDSVASVVLNALGAYTTRPVFTFTAPQLPNGVTATGTITSEATTAAVTTAGTGYVVGDLLTLTSAGGSAIAYVASVSTGAIATVNFTGTGASRGSFQALPGAKFPATLTSGRLCAGGSGTGAELTVTFRAKAVLIVEQGSGYTAVPTAATGPTQSVTFTSVAVTTDGETTRYTRDSFNTIRITAKLPGGTALESDIISQKHSRRYKIRNTDGTGVVSLVAAAPNAGEATIVATDISNKTYYVTKLTRHLATLTQYGSSGWEFATDQSVPWTFGTAVLDVSVKISNS